MLRFIIYPLLGGLIGILSNLLMLIFLFYPKKKIFGFQGLIEKKRESTAKELSAVLAEYFIDTQSLSKLITKEKVYALLKNILLDSGKKFPLFINSILSGILERAVSNIFFENGVIKQDLLQKVVTSDEAKDFVCQKIMDFDMDNLKGIAMKSMGKDIVLLIIWGGIFGCLVGAAEAFLPL